MPDFMQFANAISVLSLLIAMGAVGVIIFAPTYAKWGIKKIESLFSISFKDGFARLEAQKEAKRRAREYYRNNPNRANRSMPYFSYRESKVDDNPMNKVNKPFKFWR